MFPRIAFLMIRTTLEHGVNASSCDAFVGFGASLVREDSHVKISLVALASLTDISDLYVLLYRKVEHSESHDGAVKWRGPPTSFSKSRV